MKKIYIPSNLDLPTLLDSDYCSLRHLDRFHYLIHLIYEQRILYKNPEEFIPLKAIYLGNIIGRGSDRTPYTVYRQILIDGNIIECDRQFIKGEKSYGYRLCEKYANVRHKQIELKSKSLLRNIEKWQRSRLPITDIHLYLYEFLKQIDINYDAALNYVETMPINEYNSAKIAIDKFLNRDYFLYSDDYGRVHTNITNLKSTLRKFLLYKGQALVNIDIINSQPLLLLLTPPILHSIRCAFSIYFESGGMDIFTYKSLAEQGKLYDYLMKHAAEDSRAEFKEKFFRETFFGKRISKTFSELFPTVARLLAEIKKDDYRSLAWMMQKAESNLVINHICRRIMTEHEGTFMATIHDSILTTEDNVTKIKKIILEEFANFNLSPSIRVEPA